MFVRSFFIIQECPVNIHLDTVVIHTGWIPYQFKTSNMCSILTKGSTCRKNKKLRFFLILIEQVMTNLLKKN